MEPAGSPGPQPRCFTVFDVFIWLVVAFVVVVSAATGWQLGGFWGLVAGTLLGLLAIPVSVIVGTALVFALFGMLVFVFSVDRDFIELASNEGATDLPVPRRGVDPRPFVLVVAIVVLWAMYGLPMIREARSTKEIKEAAVVAGLFPLAAIGFASRRWIIGLARWWRPIDTPSGPTRPRPPGA